MAATQKLKQILLVEDRDDVKKALVRFLEARLQISVICASRAQEGYDVVKASVEAGEIVRWGVLTDNDMANEENDWIFSGLDLAEELRELLKSTEGDACIILITGREIPNPVSRWVDHAFEKPLNMAEICGILQQFFDSEN
ncbi:MAG: hypothetical protein RL141_969 [Candidatus Parcubacteria bacterium]|jgi:CheY-like chemotaxis protein